jgi:hypothetical protein
MTHPPTTPHGYRVALTLELRAAKCEVPDMMVMAMCNRFGGDSAAAQKCDLCKPANARDLARTATYGSDTPLLCSLPHTQAILRLQSAQRPIPHVRPPLLAALLFRCTVAAHSRDPWGIVGCNLWGAHPTDQETALQRTRARMLPCPPRWRPSTLKPLHWCCAAPSGGHRRASTSSIPATMSCTSGLHLKCVPVATRQRSL